MISEGLIRNYTAQIISRQWMIVTLEVFVKQSGESVYVQISSTLAEVCTKLNSIPKSGTIAGNHLINAACTVDEDDGRFRFIALSVRNYN